MKNIIRKTMVVWVAAGLMVTVSTREARAFGIPLLSYDIPRVAENVQKIMNMIMQVKAEVDSHMQIIKQIQHGGFGAAAGMLFAKIENGDYERLFGSFADIGINWKVNKEMSGKRAEMKAQCEKEASELAEKANKEAVAKCKETAVGVAESQKCIDSAGDSAKKIAKKGKKECLKKGYAELAQELTRVRAQQYQAAMARYAEAKAKMKAYTWLQNAGLSTTTFLTDSTIRAIGDGRIGDAIATGSSALGRGTVAFGLSSEEGANALGYLGGVTGGIAQDIQTGYGIWGKMGIGGSHNSGGSSSSESSDSSSQSSENTETQPTVKTTESSPNGNSVTGNGENVTPLELQPSGGLEDTINGGGENSGNGGSEDKGPTDDEPTVKTDVIPTVDFGLDEETPPVPENSSGAEDLTEQEPTDNSGEVGQLNSTRGNLESFRIDSGEQVSPNLSVQKIKNRSLLRY